MGFLDMAMFRVGIALVLINTTLWILYYKTENEIFELIGNMTYVLSILLSLYFIIMRNM